MLQTSNGLETEQTEVYATAPCVWSVPPWSNSVSGPFCLEIVMYGKIFASMYEGSMVGMGPTVFAVWGYCIAKADPEEHTVILNPPLLATIIGTTQEDIEAAMMSLTSSDKHSKCPDEDGKRLVHQNGHTYFVVSHEHYRKMVSNDERRAYNREMKRRSREKHSASRDVNDMSTAPASASASDVASEGESAERGSTYTAEFQAWWKEYPRKVAKKEAYRAYKRAKQQADADTLLASVRQQKGWSAWVKDGGAYIPHPATWLNQGRWEDEERVDTSRPPGPRSDYNPVEKEVF